jgi:hypothetical protein
MWPLLRQSKEPRRGRENTDMVDTAGGLRITLEYATRSGFSAALQRMCKRTFRLCVLTLN